MNKKHIATSGRSQFGNNRAQIIVYYEYLFKYAVNKLNDTELAKDLVQETFLSAIEAKETFEARSSELTWMTAILKYKIYKVYRINAKRRLTGTEGNKIIFGFLKEKMLDTGKHEQLDSIIFKEFSKAINDFITTLPVKWQHLYHLKYVDNENAEFICKALQLSPQNYWVISYRLKIALKKWYLETWIID